MENTREISQDQQPTLGGSPKTQEKTVQHIVAEPKPKKRLIHQRNILDSSPIVTKKKQTATKADLKLIERTACLPIGNGKHVKVCRYRHKPYVNIRDYTTASSG